jgi:L-amino acid N-acyltransferase YncA
MNSLELRPLSAADTDILHKIYASSRAEGMVQVALQELSKEAEAIHKTLSLSVKSFNQSLGLFARLGFVKAGESGAPLHNNSVNKES